MTKVDPREAAQALNDIEHIVARVRQSRIYDIASKILIAVGILVLAGNIATFISPRQSAYIWVAVNVLNVAIGAALITMDTGRIERRPFDFRILAAFVLFYAFGLLCSVVLGHFGPPEMGTFWAVYFMFFYCLAGLWFGRAFLAIGLGISALTLVGYFFASGASFLLWMAAVNGGGLILGGVWMRRV